MLLAAKLALVKAISVLLLLLHECGGGRTFRPSLFFSARPCGAQRKDAVNCVLGSLRRPCMADSASIIGGWEWRARTRAYVLVRSSV